MKLACFFLSGVLLAQVPSRVAVIRSAPPSGSAEIALQEQRVGASPGNLDMLGELLRAYDAAASPETGAYRIMRFNHIRELVNTAPASSLAGAPSAYVANADGPYANAADHASIASLWIAQANSHFGDSAVLLNAVRFLEIEDKAEAERLLINALAARPTDVPVAARLGFLYAAGLVGADTMDGRRVVARTPESKTSWTDHCRAELDRTNNLHVLLGASIALPNMAMRNGGGGPGYEAWVKYSEELRRRAIAIDPNAGGMPVEFGMFPQEVNAMQGVTAVPPPPPPLRAMPSQTVAPIRVGGNVAAANLVSSPAPAYPPLALSARVSGVVKFEARIGTDGRIMDLMLVSGPPLLVQAAMAAVQTWVWKPTLLNGSPVVVATTIDVPFTLPTR